jgi:NAD(P)-dependent dehydrogenase (short-subunit alcohol dehydrogenase family)
VTTPQGPLASPFDSSSTASEVIEGIDLTGKLAVVTGGYSGLGLETTRALKSAGADVIVPARRPEHAQNVLGDLAEVAQMDLGDLGSVGRFAAGLVDAGRPIDLLINNAGIMANPETRVGPGWESQLATNHFGHYALTNEIWPLLADGGARVVALSSTGHKISDIRWDDPHFNTDPYDPWVAYGQAKSANCLFAVHLDVLGKGAGVRAFAVHPGGIMTELQRHMPREDLLKRGWIDEDGKPNPLFKTPEGGASTSVWAATSPMLNGMGGVYCEDCNIASPTDLESDFARFLGVNEHAVDPESARRLWAMTAEITGINAFA